MNDFIKSQVHTTNSCTEKKKIQTANKKTKCASIKQPKARKNILMINLQLIFINKKWL